METPPEPQSVPPKTFTQEELSAIPPEIRKELNLPPVVSEKVDDDLSDIPPEVLAKVREISGKNPLGEEPGGFSWAGLVYGPLYYIAMKDTPFAIASTIASLGVYTIPALIPLAFFARKRAWNRKKWESEEQFWQVQKQWDRTAIVGGVVALVAFYFLTRYIYSTLSTTFGTTDPTSILQQFQGIYQQ